MCTLRAYVWLLQLQQCPDVTTSKGGLKTVLQNERASYCEAHCWFTTINYSRIQKPAIGYQHVNVVIP